MRDGILIGIDAGTSVIKSIAFTLDGQQLAVAAVPNTYNVVSGGGAEQDMPRTWTDTVTTLKGLAEQIPNLAERLVGIAVTGQGDGMWLIDKAGDPVVPAWLWLDARAATIIAEYVTTAEHKAHYYRTGTGVNACQMSGQLAWMSRHQPDVLRRATTAFHCKDWVYFKLTDQRATDPSEANFTFGDYQTRNYAPKILDDLGAKDCQRLLPPIVDGTAQAHGLSAAAAALTGLKAGTPVNLGFVDVICTGIGGGLFDSSGHIGCTIVGSTGMHMRAIPNAKNAQLNSAQTGYTMTMPAPNMVAQIQSNMASTLNIDWLTDLAVGILADHGLARNRADILRGLDDRVLAKPAASLLFHPYISAAGERGPFMDPTARAMFTGLEMGHDYVALLRAVFEGICFAARDCYSAMGGLPAELRITGGAARSQALRQILASTMSTNVRSVQREEAGAAGAAMIAAVQHGVFPTMQHAVSAWVDPLLGAITNPDNNLTKIYAAAFPNYLAARKAMQPIWQSMNGQTKA